MDRIVYLFIFFWLTWTQCIIFEIYWNFICKFFLDFEFFLIEKIILIFSNFFKRHIHYVIFLLIKIFISFWVFWFNFNFVISFSWLLFWCLLNYIKIRRKNRTSWWFITALRSHIYRSILHVLIIILHII